MVAPSQTAFGFGFPLHFLHSGWALLNTCLTSQWAPSSPKLSAIEQASCLSNWNSMLYLQRHHMGKADGHQPGLSPERRSLDRTAGACGCRTPEKLAHQHTGRAMAAGSCGDGNSHRRRADPWWSCKTWRMVLCASIARVLLRF